MDKQRLKSFNKQLARIYWLALIHIIISVVGVALNMLQFHHNTILYIGIFGLNAIALICFEPWRIMAYLNEGYGYKQGLEAIAKMEEK